VCALALWLCAPAWVAAQSQEASPPSGLGRLIEQALQNHPDIAAARSERSAAEFEVSAARNQFYPTPAAQLRQDKSGPTAVVSLTQPLWTGGRLTAGLNAANSRALTADTAIEEARYNLALRVVAAWAAWRLAQGRENAQAQGVELLQRYAQSVARRIQGGASAEVDRELVNSRVAQAQSDVASARSAQRVALAQLTQLLGQPPQTQDLQAAEAAQGAPGVPSAANASGARAAPPPDPETLIAQATAYAPALRRLDGDIETARFEAERQRASLWPTLNLRAEHQRSPSSATSAGLRDTRLMLTLDYAPSAGLATSANLAAAQARITSQQDAREAARRNLIDTVLADHEDQRASRERTQSNQRTLAANAAVLASYERLLDAGKRSWLDVLNMARELTAARSALSDTQAQHASASARLLLHAGLWPGLSPAHLQ